MKCLKLVLLILAISLISSSEAFGFFNAPYWTVNYTENTVYNSKWAEDHSITDISCQGLGRYRIDTASGDPAYKHFNCDLEFYKVMGVMGEVLCEANGMVNTITATKFDITNLSGLYTDGEASNCFPPNYSLGN